MGVAWILPVVGFRGRVCVCVCVFHVFQPEAWSRPRRRRGRRPLEQEDKRMIGLAGWAGWLGWDGWLAKIKSIKKHNAPGKKGCAEKRIYALDEMSRQYWSARQMDQD